MRLRYGAKCLCPVCLKYQEDPVQDYALSNGTREASREYHECWECDAPFYVENNGDGTYEVVAT